MEKLYVRQLGGPHSVNPANNSTKERAALRIDWPTDAIPPLTTFATRAAVYNVKITNPDSNALGQNQR